MPNIDAMIESKYLRKEDVGEPGDGIVCTIVALKQKNIARDDEEPKLKWLVKFKEQAKPMVLGSTTLQLLAMYLGSKETDDWIGKKIFVFHDPSITFGDKLVGGIRFQKVPTQQVAPTPQQKAQALADRATTKSPELSSDPNADPFDSDIPF